MHASGLSFFKILRYSQAMFQVARQAQGSGGSFVKLVELESDDYAVVVRYPSDSRFHHKYIGPDFMKAEEVFGEVVAEIDSRKT
jgi:hypothetical protein